MESVSYRTRARVCLVSVRERMPRPVALLSLGSLPDYAMGRGHGARKVTPIFAVSPVQPIADIFPLIKVSEIH